MIRINLLSQKDAKRKRQSGPGISLGSKAILGVFLLAVALELAALYYWYDQASTQETTALKQVKDLETEKLRLEEITRQRGDLDKLEKEVGAQREVFAELQYGKAGPLNMLLFLSYSLQRIDATIPEEEYRILTDLWTPESLRRAAGTADAEWDPRHVWLTKITETNGEILIEGRARNHEDVMTFMKRLRTAIYFDAVDFVSQERLVDGDLGVPTIEFKLSALLNYDPRGYPPATTPAT